MNLLQDLIRSKLTGSGGALPALTDPALPSDVASGKEYINGSGAKQTGTLVAYSADDWLDETKPVGVVTSDKKFASNSPGVYFDGRTGITGLHLTETLYVPPKICYKCQNLEIITAPNAIKIFENAFEGCSKIQKNIVFPKVKSMKGYVFTGTEIVAADFGGTPGTGEGLEGYQAFQRNDDFDVLVLRGAAVWKLGNINNFVSTKFESGKAGGTLYVPASLISSYQAATNWAIILGYPNNQIKSIESTATDPDAPVDLTTHYIDGTLITA